jgi:hypothetical protein
MATKATKQVKPTRKKVKLSELFIPEEYQRPFKPNWSKEIAENYRPQLFHPITVSDRNGGGLAVLDGQHRYFAAELRGDEVIDSEVWVGLSIPEEADLFAMGQKGRKPLTPLELWKARVVSGAERDPLAAAIDEIVREKDFFIGKLSTRPTELDTRSNINSVSAAEDLYKIGVLGLTLDYINLVWRRADGVVEFKATAADVLRGFGLCIDGYEDRMTPERLETLKRVSPVEIYRGVTSRTGTTSSQDQRALAALSEFRSVMGLRGKPKVKDRPRG